MKNKSVFYEIKSPSTNRPFYVDFKTGKSFWSIKIDSLLIDPPDGQIFQLPDLEDEDEFEFDDSFEFSNRKCELENMIFCTAADFVFESIHNSPDIISIKKQNIEKIMCTPYFPPDLLLLFNRDAIEKYFIDHLSPQTKGTIIKSPLSFEEIIRPLKTAMSGCILKTTPSIHKSTFMALFRGVKSYIQNQNVNSLVEITKVLDNSPSPLHDEAIVLLITETNTPGYCTTSAAAWNLLLFVCSRYSVSDDVRMLLRSYCLLGATSIGVDKQVQDLATMCLFRSSSNIPVSNGKESKLQLNEYFELCTSFYALYSFTIEEIIWKEERRGITHGVMVPNILLLIAKKLKELKAFNMEGLFRVPGSKADQTSIMKSINNGNWEVNNNVISTVASLIPLFFMTLREPVIPFEVIKRIDQKEKSFSCISVANSLSNSNRDTLCFFIGLIQELLKHEEKTKMTANNFRISFGTMLSRIPDPVSLADVKNDPHTMSLSNMFMNLIYYYRTDDCYKSLMD